MRDEEQLPFLETTIVPMSSFGEAVQGKPQPMGQKMQLERSVLPEQESIGWQSGAEYNVLLA